MSQVFLTYKNSGVVGGVTSHSGLTGLLDNDHPQYRLTATTINFSEIDNTGHTHSDYSTSSHTHAFSAITNTAHTHSLSGLTDVDYEGVQPQEGMNLRYTEFGNWNASYISHGELVGRNIASEHPQYSLTSHTHDFSGASTIGLALKSTDETRTNKTFTSDGALYFNMEANKWYRFDMYIHVSGNSSANFSYRLTYPVGCDVRHANTVGSPITLIVGSATTNITMASAIRAYHINGLALNSSNSGNFQLQWCQQNISASTPTIIFSGSYIEYRKLN